MTPQFDLIVSRHRGLLEWIATRLPVATGTQAWMVWPADPCGDGKPPKELVLLQYHGGDDPTEVVGRIPVLAHVGPDDVRGKRVLGVLPLSLARHAASVTEIELPGLRSDQRGKELTPAEMDAAGARFGEPLAVQPASERPESMESLARRLGGEYRPGGGDYAPCIVVPAGDGGDHLISVLAR